MQQLPPGLAGYVAAEQQGQQGQLGQLQQAQMLMGLQGAMQQRQQQQAEQAAIAQLGPNPTADQLGAIVARRDPSKAYDIMSRGEDKKALREERAAQFAENVRLRQEMVDQRKAEFEQRKTDAQTKALFEQWYRTETLKNQQAMGDLRTQLQQQGLQLKTSQAEDQKRQGREKQVKELGIALEKAGLPTADAVLRDVEDMLGTDSAKAKERANTIAGTDAWKPDLLVGADQQKLRQAANKLFNITLKDRSGAAVTNQELERLKQEFATGVWKSPDQFINGVTRAREIIKNHYAAVASSYGPDALKGYNENLRSLGGRVVIEPGAAAQATPAAPQFRKGQTATGPNNQKIVFDGEKWVPAQ